MKQDLCGACLAQVRADHEIKLLTREATKTVCERSSTNETTAPHP